MTAKNKVAAIASQRLSSKSWLPTLDNLRNFLLTPTEMLSFFQILRAQ